MDPRAWFPSLSLAGRELLTGLRRVSVYAVFALAVGLLALPPAAALVPWEELGDLLMGRRLHPSPLTLWQARQISFLLTRSLFVILFTAAAVVLPGLAGSAIVDEREKDTFDQLRLTLLRPAGIVVGNFVTILAFFILLIVFLLPVFAVTFFFIGVDHRDLLLPLAGITVYAMHFALGGLAASAFCRRSQTALIASYAYALFIIIGLAVGLALGDEADLWRINPEDVFLIFTPAALFVHAPVNNEHLVLALVFHVFAGLVCFLFAVANVRRPRRTAAEIIGGLAAPAAGGPTPTAARVAAGWFKPGRWRRPLPDRSNPVLSLDLRMFPGSRLLKGLAAIVAPAAGLLYLWGIADALSDNREEPLVVAMSIGLIAVLLMFPMFASRAIVKEQETQTLDYLRMTLLSPRRMVGGKFMFFIILWGPIIVALFLGLSLPVLLHDSDDETLAGLYNFFGLSLAVFLLLLGASLLASVAAKRARTAALMAYLFGAAGYLLVMLINFIFFAPFFIMAIIADSPRFFPGLSQRCREILNLIENLLDSHELFWVTVWGQANALVIAALGLLAVLAAIRYFPMKDRGK